MPRDPKRSQASVGPAGAPVLSEDTVRAIEAARAGHGEGERLFEIPEPGGSDSLSDDSKG